MRASLRLLTPRLQAFTPTGLAGVLTHPHPRPVLIALYNHTLDVLKTLPEHSVYRQSAENLTKHRLSIVEAVAPPGIKGYLNERRADGKPEKVHISELAVHFQKTLSELNEDLYEGNKKYAREQWEHWKQFYEEPAEDKQVLLEEELSAEQVEEIEAKIGEGLIEEIIEEGWGELKCAEAMKENQVWEPLEVVPEEGQWVAFERTPATGASA
ncbi:ETC complex I subunit conserved region-domain-containing protein [Pyronema omphalodes]|nr:ETC complex I subunit conserved region-domain-containing protein [Pyronema omphalodes]